MIKTVLGSFGKFFSYRYHMKILNYFVMDYQVVFN
jgi:hypothetical protein